MFFWWKNYRIHCVKRLDFNNLFIYHIQKIAKASSSISCERDVIFDVFRNNKIFRHSSRDCSPLTSPTHHSTRLVNSTRSSRSGWSVSRWPPSRETRSSHLSSSLQVLGITVHHRGEEEVKKIDDTPKQFRDDRDSPHRSRSAHDITCSYVRR